MAQIIIVSFLNTFSLSLSVLKPFEDASTNF